MEQLIIKINCSAELLQRYNVHTITNQTPVSSIDGVKIYEINLSLEDIDKLYPASTRNSEHQVDDGELMTIEEVWEDASCDGAAYSMMVEEVEEWFRRAEPCGGYIEPPNATSERLSPKQESTPMPQSHSGAEHVLEFSTLFGRKDIFRYPKKDFENGIRSWLGSMVKTQKQHKKTMDYIKINTYQGVKKMIKKNLVFYEQMSYANKKSMCKYIKRIVNEYI